MRVCQLRADSLHLVAQGLHSLGGLGAVLALLLKLFLHFGQLGSRFLVFSLELFHLPPGDLQAGGNRQRIIPFLSHLGDLCLRRIPFLRNLGCLFLSRFPLLGRLFCSGFCFVFFLGGGGNQRLGCVPLAGDFFEFGLEARLRLCRTGELFF